MSSRHIAVVPSTSMPLGLAAMVAYDPESDAVGNARVMQEAMEGVTYAEVTFAVRESELDGVLVREGQAMGLVDGRLAVAADDLATAFEGVLRAFAEADAEYVTVLTALNGSSLDRNGVEELASRHLPDAEVHVHEGGQPLYPILASAE
jgi:dihydroxyacetone kinase-like predicted kinase